MKKRILSFLLSAVILLGMICMSAPSVSAAYDMKASDGIIELIKSFEGFTDRPYQDNGQWSVGYGCAVTGQELAKYQAYGITDAEADALLRKYVAEFETYVNAFAKKYSLNLNQARFDALVSFTYNLGSNWMNNDSTLRQAVLDGDTGNDFLFAFTRWCTANDAIQENLVKRRLSEANVYLNGVYSTSVPSNFKYVIFDNNIANPVTNVVRIQGYDASSAVSIRSTPSKSGYRFLGWYTAAEGGECINVLNSGVSVDTLYAHWQKGNGETDENGDVVGTAAKYQHKITESSSRIVREKPSASAAEVKTLSVGATVTIVSDYVDASGVKWGKLSGGGWLDLATGVWNDEVSGDAIDPVTVQVLSSGVNIRSGPGTKYETLGKFTKGEKLVITAVEQSGSNLWGKSASGWIFLNYTDYDLVTAEKSSDASVVTATGVVVKTDVLNVRSGPGTKYEAVAKYSRGDQVSITLQEKAGSSTWGLTDKGWISLYYVDLTPVAGETTPEPETPDATEPPASGGSETQPEQVVATGVVTGCDALNVRSGAGTKYGKVGKIALGTYVEIYEQIKVGKQTWGRISQGWICMSYVKTTVADSGTDTGNTGTSDTNSGENNTSGTAVSGTVVKCSYVNVRSGAGTKNTKVGKLAKGTRVVIYETAMVGKNTWGRTEQGWVHMYYIQLDDSSSAGSTGSSTSGSGSTTSGTAGNTGTSTTTSGQTGTVYRTDELRIRSAAGVKNAEVGTLARGSKVVILETTKVGSTTWGRIEQGWICMYYVQLDSVEVPSGSIVRTVTVSGLRIRSAAGTSNEVVGSYDKGTQVVILEQTTVNGRPWGRTDKGWISLDYVK